jgi:hypothetical protein
MAAPSHGPNPDTVLNWFRFHPATPETGPIHEIIRDNYRDLAQFLLTHLPEGADKTIALRALQAAMWAANACVANSTPEAAQ